MFCRQLTETVLPQQKTVVQGDLGTTEVWVDGTPFRAAVTAFSSDRAKPGMGANRTEATRVENTDQLYTVLARNLNRDWSFAATRFLWLASDGDPGSVIYLKPKKDILKPGRRGRGWAKILCEDITDLSGDPAVP